MTHVTLQPKRALVLMFALIAGTHTSAIAQGIPVMDAGNLTQNVMTAMESVAQTLKQIQQYQLQLQQYENQLQNTAAPSSHVWDRAQTTINSLLAANNTLQYYKSQLGSTEAYLNKFQDADYYRNSPCFSANGCTAAEWNALQQSRALGSASQKRANDSMFRGLELQHQNLSSDAVQLERLQSNAQGASGQLQAIGYANQLASQQANQLLQIRALLLSQQSAVTTRMQAQANLEAQQQAAHAASVEPRIRKTTNPKNWFEYNRR